MNFPEQDTKIQAQIEAIQLDEQIPQKQKNQKVLALRTSKLLSGNETSTHTVMSLANTMIGSAVIVYPILFIKDGMLTSSIIMCVVGCVQFLTCRLLVTHNRTDEVDFNASILRIGGKKADIFNSIINILLLFLVCIIYYQLVVENFFQISTAFITNYGDKKKIIFNLYSIQWVSIICSCLCLTTLFRNNIQPLFKFVPICIYCMGAYFIFLFLNFIRHLVQGRIKLWEYKLIDPDFSTVAGSFALSFIIHPTASPILKKNINLNNNKRDLLFGYGLTLAIYFFVGFVGSLSCQQKLNQIYQYQDNYITVFDCLKQPNTSQQRVFFIIAKIVQTGILFQNFAILPILFFIARKQFITLIKKLHYFAHLEKRIFVLFTVVFLIVATIIGILNIQVSVMLSFDGAIIGFFMVYGIPIYIHLKCLFHKYTKQQNKKRKSIIESSDQLSSNIQNMLIDQQIYQQMLRCNKHRPSSKFKHYLLYGCILLFGILLGIFKIITFFHK